jgi:hypothetical protein
VQLTFALSTALTLPLQMLPFSQIIESTVRRFCARAEDSKVAKLLGHAYRVLALAAFAFTAHCFAAKLDLVIAVVGTFFGLPINCIFPSLISLASSRRITQETLVDLVIILLTLSFMALCLNNLAKQT